MSKRENLQTGRVDPAKLDRFQEAAPLFAGTFLQNTKTKDVLGQIIY